MNQLPVQFVKIVCSVRYEPTFIKRFIECEKEIAKVRDIVYCYNSPLSVKETDPDSWYQECTQTVIIYIKEWMDTENAYDFIQRARKNSEISDHAKKWKIQQTDGSEFVKTSELNRWFCQPQVNDSWCEEEYVVPVIQEKYEGDNYEFVDNYDYEHETEGYFCDDYSSDFSLESDSEEDEEDRRVRKTLVNKLKKQKPKKTQEPTQA
jgi:hypothetical protein